MKKDIYFYWGNETMSYMRYMTLYSFCKFNPDWTVYLIKNNQTHERYLINTIVEKQDKTEYKGKDYSYLIDDLNINILDFQNKMINLDDKTVSCMSDVHIKDILNWKILGECGGVVADMDIIFIKPLLNEINSDAEIGLICFEGYPKKDYIPVSFMYSSSKNIFFESVYKNALKNYNPDVYESCGTLCIKEKNLKEIITNFPSLKIQQLKSEIVFPLIKYYWDLGVQMLYKGDYTNKILPSSIGIHWYGGTLLSQRYNNKIDDQSVHKINNTITVTIRNILQEGASRV